MCALIVPSTITQAVAAVTTIDMAGVSTEEGVGALTPGVVRKLYLAEWYIEISLS